MGTLTLLFRIKCTFQHPATGFVAYNHYKYHKTTENNHSKYQLVPTQEC
jgi:hypothetical protein